MNGKQLSTRVMPALMLLVFAAAATIGIFAGGPWGGFGIASAILMFVGVWCKDGKASLPQTNLVTFAFIVLVVFALLNFHSSYPAISWKEEWKLLTIFVPLLLFFSPRVEAAIFHRAFFPVMLIACVAGSLALSVELSQKGPLLYALYGDPVWLTEYNRGISYFVIMAFPVMAGLMFGPFPLELKKRIWILIPFILILLMPMGLTESRASKLAFVVGLAAVFVAQFWPTLVRWGLMGITVLSVGWPFADQAYFAQHSDTLGQIPLSWQARVEIWDYMSYRIMEKPWLGWGLGASHKLDFAQPNGAKYVLTTWPASHPHNVMTQLWVELGVPGLLLGLAFAALILFKTKQFDKKIVPYALGCFAAALCLSLVAYDFWTDSMYAAYALSGLMFVMLQKNRVSA